MPNDFRRSNYTRAKSEKRFQTKRAIEDTRRRQQIAKNERLLYETSLPDRQFMMDLLMMSFEYWTSSSPSDEVLDSKESLPETFDRPTRYSSSPATINKIMFATMVAALLIGAATGAEGAVLPTAFRDNRRASRKQCELTTRTTFGSAAKQVKSSKITNPVVIEDNVYQMFPNCSSSQVQNYLKQTTKESIETSVFATEIKSDRHFHNITVKFSANPSSFFPSAKRGEASFIKHEVTEVVSRSTNLVSERVEHQAMLATMRHEWSHHLEARKNMKWIPCLVKNGIRINAWIAAPYLPSDSSAYLQSWAKTLKQGLERLESGRISPEILPHYAPRIWIMDSTFSSASLAKIKSDISEKRYSNIVFSTKDEIGFKELSELFSAKKTAFNLYIYQVDEQTKDNIQLYYGVVRYPNDADPKRLLYALLWDIKARIFQYSIDFKAGKKDFAYNVAEIDAFIGGLHREIINAIFPEWLNFHKELFDEANRCKMPPAKIAKDGSLDTDGVASRPMLRNEL